MATDLYGRSIGDNVSVNQVNQQLLSPTQETKRPDAQEVNNDPDKKESALENLYEAINRVAEKIDSNASKDLEESKNWSKNIIDFHKDFRNTSRSDESGQKTQTGFLDLASKAIQNLWVASQSQNTIWVGISKLSNNAVQEISKSFSMSDCCEALGEATATVRGLDNLNSGVSEASKTVLSEAGGGGRGTNWGGGDDDSDDGGDGGSRRRGDSSDASDFELPDAGDMTGVIARMSTITGLISLAANSFVDLHRSVIKALDIDPIQKIFDGQILEHNNFRESIRALIHEQEGFGASNRQIEKTFINLESSINAAGVGSAKFKTMYLKNLERGLSLATAEDNRYVDALSAQKKGFTIEQKESALRERKVNRLKSIQTTALSTASSLHMSSDAMNELFMNWHMNLGLSEQSLAEIGSHMKNVSRSTGVTGSQLEKAMISADGVMKNLKKAGMVSTDTAKRVTEFMAAAQKHGFEGAAELMNVLGGGETFHDSKYKLFLGNAARFSDKPEQGVRDLVLGNTMNRSGGMENLFGGAERFVRSQLSGFETALNSVGLKSSTLDVTNLSEVMNKLRAGGKLEEAEALKRRFKGLGIEIGEVERALKTMQEETLSSSKRIDKYSKELESMKAQGLEKTDAYKQIQKKLLEAQTGQSQDVFGRIKSVMDNKEGKTGGQLEKELKDSLIQVLGDEKAAAEWQSNLPAKASEAVSQMRERAKAEGLNFDDMLKEKGITGGESQLTKGLLEGDALSNQAMTEIMQRISKKEKQGEDPITDIKGILEEIHTTLAQKLDNVGFGLSDMIVKILYVAGYLGGILMTVASGILALRMLQNIPGLLSGISGVFGGLNKALGNPLEKIFGKGGKGPLGGLLGDCLPVCPPSGGGGQMMPRRPTGGSPVVPPSPTTGPMTTVSPSGRPKNTTVLPGGPDYGGGGWAGAQGTQYQSPTVRDAATGQVTRRDMSRSDRRANAERYLDARRAAGQSGRGFGPRAGSGIRRVAPQGKGWMGLAGKIANFAMAHPTLTGTAIGATTGAVHGYATSDEKGWGAVGDSLFEGAVGGGIGAAAGYGAGRLGGAGKGLQAGGLPGIADGAMDVVASGANMMGMPGFGSDCMPVWVCNFGEMGGMGGLLPGMGDGGMAQTALDTLNTVDMASDVAGMMGKGKNVAQVVDKADDVAKGGSWLSKMFGGGNKAVTAVAGGADDVAKGGSWLSKMFGGGNKAVTAVAGGADDVAKGGSWLSKMFGGGNKAVTAVAGGADDVVKGAGLLSKIPGAGLAKGVGSLLGKVAAPLQLFTGAITGAMDAESAGRTTAEGAAYGALTGGAHKGSFASEALGIQKGSVADESLGIAGGAAWGATLGAGVGTMLAPFTAGISIPVAAAVGGVIGAGAELVKVFTAEESSMRDAVTGFASSIGSTIMELPGTIGGAFQTVGSYLGEGAHSIYASITGFASSLGSTFTSGITSVANGIGGFASSLGNSVSESFSSTAKENWDRMLQGASFSGALGQVTGGIVDVVNGNLTQGLTKVGLSGVEAFGALGQTILGAASSLNPFSWFKNKEKTSAKETESSPEKKLAETANKETQKTQQDVMTQSAEKLQEAAVGLDIGKTEQDFKAISEASSKKDIDLSNAMVASFGNVGDSKEISKALSTQNSAVFNSILAEQESLIKSISQKRDAKSSGGVTSDLGSKQGFFDSNAKGFLANAALRSSDPIAYNSLQTGTTLQTPDGVKGLMSGQEILVKEIFSGFESSLNNVGVQSATIDVGNLSEVIQKLQKGGQAEQQAATSLQRQFEALGTNVGEVENNFKIMSQSSKTPQDLLGDLSFKLNDMNKQGLQNTDEYKSIQKQTLDLQSDLQNSSDVVQKQSTPVEATTSLQGVFEKTQASEALTSNIDTAIKWQKIEPSEQTLAGELSGDSKDKNNFTVYDQSVESILFKIFDQLKSFNLTNIFEKDSSLAMMNLDHVSVVDSQKKSIENKRQFEGLDTPIRTFEQMPESLKDLSSMESSLQNSSNIIQKQSVPVETTTSLQGVFDKTQASEALTSNIDTAIKWQKIEPSSLGSGFEKKWNTLKDNEFNDLESKSPMKRMFGYDRSEKQNKMSYQGTGAGAALGAALGGPIGIPAGAAAGFVYDTVSSNLNIQDALSQTISNIGENTKGVLNSLSLGLFDNEKAAEAQDSSLEYSVKNIAPSLIAGSLAGVTGGMSSFALPMINQLMQGQPNQLMQGQPNQLMQGQPSDILQQVLTSKQINKPEVSSNQLGLFDNEKAAEAQDSSLEYSVKNIAPSLIAGSLAGVTGGMSSFALPMINQLMQGQPSDILQQVLTSKQINKPEVSSNQLGLFDNEKAAEAQDSSLEYSVKNIAPSLIAGSLAGVTGGMSSFALPMINQLMQGQPNQKNLETSELLKEKFKEPEGFIEANPQSLGVFDFEKTGEAEEGYFKQLGASYVDPKDFMTTAPIPIVGDIINLLSNVGSKIFGSTKGSVGVSSLGMFDPSQPSEANDSESDLMLKKIQGSQNFDLNRYNLNAIENSIKNKSNLEKNVVLETSRALDYDRQASEAADSAKINELDYRSDKRGDIESNPMDYTDDMGDQSINPTYMDYRDQMKGEVGTLGISRYGMESAVMQSKYGEQPTGNSSVLPSMDTIANYLTGMQSTKLDMMIKHLQEIRDRLSTQTTSYSNVIGSAASGGKPPDATGVKSIARDFVSGSWDLPYGDYTSGTVNTEGRF